MGLQSAPKRVDAVLQIDAFGEVERLPDPLPSHLDGEVQLAEDLWIGPFTPYRFDMLDQCEPRGLNWEPPIKQFGANYGIYRVDPPVERVPFFDQDRRLWTCLQLTRLIRPTSIDFQYAGRLEFEGESVSRFEPARRAGCGETASVADPTQNWIRDEDIAPIQGLLVAFRPDQLPDRVTRAMWHHEFAHQAFYVDVRWPVMTMGLESLVHTDRARSTAQFVDRLLGVQATMEVDLAGEEELREMYDRRSQLAHGRGLGAYDDETRALYISLENLLRSILVRAITDANFAARFQSVEEVKVSWPLS